MRLSILMTLRPASTRSADVISALHSLYQSNNSSISSDSAAAPAADDVTRRTRLTNGSGTGAGAGYGLSSFEVYSVINRSGISPHLVDGMALFVTALERGSDKFVNEDRLVYVRMCTYCSISVYT